MRIAVLGTLEITPGEDGGAAVDGLAPKERLLLARLTSDVGHPVSVAQLIAALWGERPPPSATKSLQAHVVRLRSFLEPERARGSTGSYVVRHGTGYALAVSPTAVDAGELAVRCARGQALLEQGAAAEARAELVAATSLLRGEPYADWPDADWASVERRRLGELAFAARVHLADADLALGRPDDAVAALERLLETQPYREEVWARLARALYAGGRPNDALSAVARARAVLVDDLGLDPGPELVELERQVLMHDPALLVPRPQRAEAPRAPQPAAGACPWKGLAAYDSSDAALFHGRERLVAALTARLVDHDLVVLAGASGSGKSSVVRAGLVPALAAGTLPGSESWAVRVALPSQHPDAALASLSDGAPCLLVLDQLEEFWTGGVERAGRAAALDEVLDLLDDGRVSRVVAVLRSDHLHRLSEHPAFAERAGSGLVLASPLTADELRRVVEEPAAGVGLTVDPELLTAVVEDVAGEPGALPLLSTALVATWERRRGDRLELGGYLAAGGAAGAVARTAEEAWGQLDHAAREAARPMLLRLAGEGDGGRPVRRRVPLDELGLDGPDGPARWAVVETLVRQRLLAVDDGRLEVAHEALLTAWPRLAQWLVEDAEGRALRAHLSPAARDWDAKGRPPEDLYRGARLAGALGWAADHDDQLVAVERDFLAAGRAAADAELVRERGRADRERRGRRRTRRLAAALAGALAVVLLATGLALVQRDRADERAAAAARSSVIADANRLAATSGTADGLDASLLLATEAVRTADTAETEDGLLAALVAHRQAVSMYRMPTEAPPSGLAVSADGRTLFVRTQFNALQSVELTRPTDVRELLPVGEAHAMSASSANGVVATTSRSDVTVVDRAGRTPLRMGVDGLGGSPTDVQLSPDGRRVLVAVDPDGPDVGRRFRVVRVDVASATVTGRTPPITGEFGGFSGGAVTALLWTGRGASPLSVLDLRSGSTRPVPGTRLLDAESVGVTLFAGALAWRSEDGGITLQAVDGRVLQRVVGHLNTVQQLRLSPNGRTAVSVGDDRRVVVWDVLPGPRLRQREVFTGHEGQVSDVAFSPDGARAYTASLDGAVIGWDLRDRGRFGLPTAAVPGRFVSKRPVRSRGRWVVPTRPLDPAGGDDNSQTAVALAFVDPRTGRTEDLVPVGATVPGYSFASAVAVSPDDRRLAAAAGAHGVLLDAGTRRVVRRFTLMPPGGGEPEVMWDLSWTRDGRWLLVATEGESQSTVDGAVVVLDGRTLRPVARIAVGDDAQSFALSPDGRTVAVGLDNRSWVVIIDLATRKVVRTIELSVLDNAVLAVSFSPDGGIIAGSSDDGRLFLVDAVDGHPVRQPPRLHDGFVLDIRWLDDRTVATTGGDGRAVLYDVRRGLVRGPPLPFTAGGGEAWGFIVPDTPGRLVVLGRDQPGRSFPLSVSSWMAHACIVAGRDLTAAEWASYVPARPYRKTCGDLS